MYYLNYSNRRPPLPRHRPRGWLVFFHKRLNKYSCNLALGNATIVNSCSKCPSLTHHARYNLAAVRLLPKVAAMIPSFSLSNLDSLSSFTARILESTTATSPHLLPILDHVSSLHAILQELAGNFQQQDVTALSLQMLSDAAQSTEDVLDTIEALIQKASTSKAMVFEASDVKVLQERAMRAFDALSATNAVMIE